MSLRERGEGRKEERKGERKEGCVKDRDRVGRKENGSRYPVSDFANILPYC